MTTQLFHHAKLTSLCFSILCFATSHSMAANDLSIKLQKKHSTPIGTASLSVVSRHHLPSSKAQQTTRFYYYHVDMGMSHKPSALGNSVNLHAHYRHISRRDKDLTEHRYILGVQKKWNAEPVTFTTRLRHEWRDRQHKDLAQRSRLQLKLTPNLAQFSITPHLSSEWFYDLEETKPSKHRLSIGMSYKRIMGIKPSIGYLRNYDLTQNRHNDRVALTLRF